ncbi:hypothetical protein GJ496_010712 [Pomphorhynchus laevis]|nr:hypothetical protein GJ496_010712 [Pomphorhynchus laevis]
MSWLFGINRPTPSPSSGGSDNTLNSGGVGGSGRDPEKSDADKTGRSESTYRFDSAALERAAKAAKELESSRYAGEAFKLASEQERTKQLEYQAMLKQFSASEEEHKGDNIRQHAEERRKLMEEETRQANVRNRYQDELARKRHEDQLRQQAAMQEEIFRKQEESVAKQEAIRKQTSEYEAEVKHQYDMKRLEAELKGKAKIERENRDIYLEQLKLKAEEHRRTVMDGINTAGSIIGSGFKMLLDHPDKLLLTGGAVTLIAAGIYSAKMATSVCGKYVQSRLGKPALIRYTSRITPVEAIKHPIHTVKRLRSRVEDSLHGVFLEPKLEERLRELALTTRNTKSNKGLLRNILMYGPPGTGKTLFAKKLAFHSGMDYAIMTGGDVAPLCQDAVSSIHKVFDWANTSRRGLLLFLDEADAFLRKRSTEKISEDMRSALNAFLYRTGEQSDKFMLVVASNEPEQFDWALNDRIDEIVQFNLPGIEERKRMIFHYFDKYILSSLQGKRKIKLGDFNFTEVCNIIASKTDGFSGREISKLLVSCQASAFASNDCTLTERMIMDKLHDCLESHQKKVLWNTEALSQ